MNPVLADWLTLLFAPIGIILLLAALISTRSAKKEGRPIPGPAKVMQGFGAAFLLIVALLRLLAGS